MASISRCIPTLHARFRGESFNEIGAAEAESTVVGDGRLMRDDLLRARAIVRGELVGSGPGLIQRIGVQRLRATEHRGEGLNRGANDVVVGCCAVKEQPAVCV